MRGLPASLSISCGGLSVIYVQKLFRQIAKSSEMPDSLDLADPGDLSNHGIE
jgi:hypothetical protein